MNKLDEIVARYSSEGDIEAVQIADDLGLLVLAVRQLGAVYSFDGWRSLAEIGRLDPDVLELIEGVTDARE